MRGIFSTLAIVWRIASPYFYSEDRWAGRILLAAVVAIELSIVGINVLLNTWNNTFYNALQDKNWDAFIYQLGYFCVLATIYILLAVYQLYLNQWLQIRWRRWLTQTYLDHWLTGANHYRMQLLGDAADNPDQRIAEDVKQFIDAGTTGIGVLPIGLGLLNSVVTLGSFAIILWNLSGTAPLQLFGTTWAIPGYLFWAALIYAIIGTALTHLVGRALTALNFQQQRYEADFRFNLVRVRENSEQIALLDGERAERDRLLTRFGNVVANWLAIMSRQKKLTFLTAGYSSGLLGIPLRRGESGLFCRLDPARRIDADRIGLRQRAGRAVVLHHGLSATRRMAAPWSSGLPDLMSRSPRRKRLRIRRLSSRLRAGQRERGELRGSGRAACRMESRWSVPAAISIKLGERVLVSGPSGAGKSTLFRALAGVWPFGEGTHHGAERRADDDPAAAAILPDRAACRGGRLSGRARQFRCRPVSRS